MASLATMLMALVAEIVLVTPPPVVRARALVARMNQTERLLLVNGVWGLGWGPPEHPYVGNIPAVPRVGVPWLSLQDGPQGYSDGRYGHYPGPPGLPSGTATQWPSGLTIAATWDPLLAREWGTAMGLEFRAKGANVQLGPGLNVARVPRGGRNFEYISGEDPLLGAAMAGPVVAGIQSNGVIATAKHYIANKCAPPCRSPRTIVALGRAHCEDCSWMQSGGPPRQHVFERRRAHTHADMWPLQSSNPAPLQPAERVNAPHCR